MATHNVHWCVGLVLVAVLSTSDLVHAQNNNGNNTNATFGGIQIDAEGVVTAITPLRESAAAAKKRHAAFLAANLPRPLAVKSELRRVSLVRLDAQLQELTEAGQEIPLELRYLAGLTRVDFVIVDREEGDISIAGPAEGFAPDLQGRVRGVVSGRPVLNLEDLLVAWRAVNSGRTFVSCSIDPTKDGIAAFNNYTSQNLVAQPGTIHQLFNTMAARLGRQVITIEGVPRDSHFAVVLVEADLRMKRIAIGKDPSRVKGVTSHLHYLRAGGNTLSRWWFTPLYDPIQANDDRSLYQLTGPRLQLLGQDEFTNAQGDRANAAFTRGGTTKFVQQFTDHIPELAVAHPEFAELQNLFDWMVVSTLIRQHQLDTSVQWQPRVLSDEKVLPSRVYPIPEGVDSVAMTNRVGQTVLGLVGGVVLNANSVVSQTVPFKSEPDRPLPARPVSGTWSDVASVSEQD